MHTSTVLQSKLPKEYWFHAFNHGVYIMNMLPSFKLKSKSSYEVMFGKERNYKEMKSFGALCFLLLPMIMRDKLDPKSTRCIFLGYAKDHKGYKFLRCDNNKIFISRNVRFHEEVFPGLSTHLLILKYLPNYSFHLLLK